jgi:hypothetical protein
VSKFRLSGIIAVLILGLMVFQGCSYMAKIPVLKELPYVQKTEDELQPTDRKLDARLIAVLPVDIKTGSSDAARMLREKLIDELYFKGYQKIPFEMVDAALADIRKRDGGASGSTVAPQVIGSMLGVDAVMYTTLLEANIAYKVVYAPVNVAAVFELKEVKTGMSIWKYESRATDRDYGVTRNSLELGTSKIFEDVVHEAVKKAMETLPDGPGIR